MCAQQKQVTQMHYHWGQTAAKKRIVAILNKAHQAKRQCNFDNGWLEQQKCNLHSFF